MARGAADPLRSQGGQGPRGGRLGPRALLLGCLAVAACAALWLLCVSSLFDPSRLHVHGAFVDQGGYVRTARFLADTGELRFGLIFPAFAADPDWRPYMPGHFVVLAGSYLLFGYGVLASLLPSLAGFVLSTVAVFLVGHRLGGWGRGATAAALYGLFPAHSLYAFTAMSEMTLACACASSLAVFVHLPRSARPWVLSAVLVLPFLFRETGALYVLPLAGLVWADGRRRAAVVAALGAVVVLGLVNQWQVAEGKRVPAFDWLAAGEFNYQDPSAPEATVSVAELPGAIVRNARRNLDELAQQARLGSFPEVRTGTGLQALLLLVALVAWLRARPDGFALGALLLALVFLALAFGLYDVKAHKLMRGGLFAMPALVVAAAGAVDLRTLLRRGGARARAALALLLAGALVGSYAGARQAGEVLRSRDDYVSDVTAALQGLGHDARTMLVVEFRLASPSMDYAIRHYPVPWSFLPEPFDDRGHWRILAGRHPIGTVLVFQRWEGEKPPGAFLGLRYRKTVRIRGVAYHVYQPPERLRQPRGGDGTEAR